MKNKRAMEGQVSVIIGIVIAMVIAILLMSNTWGPMAQQVEDVRGSYSHDFVLTNTSAENMYGSNCWADAITCINTSGTETVASGNYTFTVATCSVTGADGGDYNNTNITCTYDYTSGASGNLTNILTTIPDETNSLFGFVFVAIFISIIIGVYGLWKRFSK